MFQPYKARSVKQGQKVEVYWNLHKGGWSVRDAQTKLVLGHVRGSKCTLLIGSAEYVVNEAGRQRTIREKRKNVHAWVAGDWCGTVPIAFVSNSVGVYNPYKYATFVDGETKEPLTGWFPAIALCARVTHYVTGSE